MEVPIAIGQRSDADARAMYDRMRLEIGAIPGVKDVGIGSTIPLRSTPFQLDVKAERRQLGIGEAQPHAEFRTADPGYFRASGIPLIKGREFATTDRDSSARVVIINKTLADKFFPDRDPIGQRITWTGEVLKFIGMHEEWKTVVGVVGDTKDGGLDAEAAERGVPAVHADAGVPGRGARDPRRSRSRERRGVTRAGGDATGSRHRAPRADRERADGRPDSRRERGTAPAQRDAGLVVRHSRPSSSPRSASPACSRSR